MATIKAKQLDTSGIVSRDASPSLSANLNVVDKVITTGTTNGNIKLEPNGSGAIEIRGASSNDGVLQLNCSNNSHGVKIKSPPHSAAANYTLTLPDDTGTNGQVLKTNGSGSLSWTTAGGASRPTVTLDNSGTDSTISISSASVLEDIYLIDNGSTAVTITLPTVTSNGGYKVQIKRLGTANVTVNPGTATIDGATSQVLSVQYSSFTLTTDGTNWYII